MGLRGPLPKTMEKVWKELLSEAIPDGDCLLVTAGRSVGIGYRNKYVEGRYWYVHQIADRMTRGPAPLGTVLRHTCDQPNCINPEHLLRGTHTDNAIDKYRKRRHSHGEGHYRARLTIEQVREIREATGTYQAIGDRYGISRGGIHNIKSGRSWRLSQ